MQDVGSDYRIVSRHTEDDFGRVQHVESKYKNQDTISTYGK